MTDIAECVTKVTWTWTRYIARMRDHGWTVRSTERQITKVLSSALKAKRHLRNDIVGQHGTAWTRTAKDREGWMTLAEGCIVQWKDCLFVGCLTSQQHASVSQGRICSDNFTCCHTETEAADQTFHLTQSQYTDTGPTSPSADPITPGAWQSSHLSANF